MYWLYFKANPKDASYLGALVKATKKDKIQKYYSGSAETSKSLIVDIPRGFKRIAKKREKPKKN